MTPLFLTGSDKSIVVALCHFEGVIGGFAPYEGIIHSLYFFCVLIFGFCCLHPSKVDTLLHVHFQKNCYHRRPRKHLFFFSLPAKEIVTIFEAQSQQSDMYKEPWA